MFYFMKANKKGIINFNRLSLPNIANKSVIHPSSSNKLKIDMLRKSKNLACEEIKKNGIINLQEINNNAHSDRLVKNEQSSEKRRVLKNKEPIDLWKLKHRKIELIKSQMGKQDKERSYSLIQYQKEVQEAIHNVISSTKTLGKIQRMEENNEIADPEKFSQFSIRKVTYERKERKKLKILRVSSKKNISKERKKIVIPIDPQDSLNDDKKTEKFEPEQWQVKKNNFSEEDEIFINSKLEPSAMIQLLDQQILKPRLLLH